MLSTTMALDHGIEEPASSLCEDEIPLLTPEEAGVPLDVELESDEPEMESSLHLAQMILLLECLKSWWREREDYFAAGNLTIYYKREQLEKREFRGPDFFVVLGVDPRPRKSWMVWREGGRYPNIIVEILSEKTQAKDRGLKKQIYQDIFRTPEYFLFDPETLRFEGYRLSHGRYVPITPDVAGRLPSEELGLLFGIHEKSLRFFTTEGMLVPSPAEALEIERQRVSEIERKAEQVQQEKERLAAKLRALGVDPDAGD